MFRLIGFTISKGYFGSTPKSMIGQASKTTVFFALAASLDFRLNLAGH
jgi:hypothetical protein